MFCKVYYGLDIKRCSILFVLFPFVMFCCGKIKIKLKKNWNRNEVVQVKKEEWKRKQQNNQDFVLEKEKKLWAKYENVFFLWRLWCDLWRRWLLLFLSSSSSRLQVTVSARRIVQFLFKIEFVSVCECLHVSSVSVLWIGVNWSSIVVMPVYLRFQLFDAHKNEWRISEKKTESLISRFISRSHKPASKPTSKWTREGK